MCHLIISSVNKCSLFFFILNFSIDRSFSTQLLQNQHLLRLQKYTENQVMLLLLLCGRSFAWRASFIGRTEGCRDFRMLKGHKLQKSRLLSKQTPEQALVIACRFLDILLKLIIEVCECCCALYSNSFQPRLHRRNSKRSKRRTRHVKMPKTSQKNQRRKVRAICSLVTRNIKIIECLLIAIKL